MKKLIYGFCSLLFLLPSILLAQLSDDTVVFVDGRLSNKEEVMHILTTGMYKNIRTGVTQQQRDSLQNLYGDRIGENTIYRIALKLLEDQEIILKNRKRKDQIKLSTIQSSKKGFTIASSSNSSFKVESEQLAPTFDAKLLYNGSVSLASLKGQVVLLNFWSTTCGPCLQEFHEMPERILIPNKDQAFHFLPIAIGESESTVREMVEKLSDKGIQLPTAVDSYMEIWDKYAMGAIPKNVLIDKEGKVRIMLEGYNEQNMKVLEETITELLNE